MMSVLKQLFTNIANLFKVKTIITLAVISTLCYLTIKDKVDVVAFVGIASSIIAFYFTKAENVKGD